MEGGSESISSRQGACFPWLWILGRTLVGGPWADGGKEQGDGEVVGDNHKGPLNN
jgi:hypothetical protein